MAAMEDKETTEEERTLQPVINNEEYDDQSQLLSIEYKDVRGKEISKPKLGIDLRVRKGQCLVKKY